MMGGARRHCDLARSGLCDAPLGFTAIYLLIRMLGRAAGKPSSALEVNEGRESRNSEFDGVVGFREERMVHLIIIFVGFTRGFLVSRVK